VVLALVPGGAGAAIREEDAMSGALMWLVWILLAAVVVLLVLRGAGLL
jgi:hypothetical protein